MSESELEGVEPEQFYEWRQQNRDIDLRLVQELGESKIYDQYLDGKWLGSVRFYKDLHEDRLTLEDEFFLFYDRHDKAGKFLYPFCKLKGSPSESQTDPMVRRPNPEAQ